MARATRGVYVFLHGEQVGVAARSRRGAVHFSYSADRRISGTPLSLSVPVGQRDSFEISPWIDGLLPPTTLRQWSRTAAQLGIDVTTDALRDMTEALPEAFETAEAQCPEWASGTAREVCERIVAHADNTVQGTASESQA